MPAQFSLILPSYIDTSISVYLLTFHCSTQQDNYVSKLVCNLYTNIGGINSFYKSMNVRNFMGENTEQVRDILF